MPAVVRPAAAGMTRSRRTRLDDGAAAVEMALVLPLLLFVLFGVIDFGRMLNAQITLTEAAREGARAAALAPPNDADSQRRAAHARVQAATPDLPEVTDTLANCPATGSASANAVVTTNVSFTFITPLAALAPLFGGGMRSSFPLKGTGVMPCVG
jgi:Flp pilus assembly protein TadG